MPPPAQSKTSNSPTMPRIMRTVFIPPEDLASSRRGRRGGAELTAGGGTAPGAPPGFSLTECFNAGRGTRGAGGSSRPPTTGMSSSRGINAEHFGQRTVPVNPSRTFNTARQSGQVICPTIHLSSAAR